MNIASRAQEEENVSEFKLRNIKAKKIQNKA